MAGGGSSATVLLWLRREAGLWYGVAEAEGRLVATSVDATREGAWSFLESSLPAGAPRRAGEGPSAFADATASMLAAIEAGDESHKDYELSPEYRPEPQAAVFRLVASIPAGYASSYGAVAEAAGTIARLVGHLMATNPLYPLVPCHRVVGSDLGLVGYRGATSGPDLDDKLARLKTEARGFDGELVLAEARGLRVFPVEWVIRKVEADLRGTGQLPLF